MADEVKIARRRYNNLTDFEDCRRNLARWIRKAERGKMSVNDAAKLCVATRVLMEAIREGENAEKLKEVEEALLELRKEMAALRKEKEEA